MNRFKNDREDIFEYIWDLQVTMTLKLMDNLDFRKWFYLAGKNEEKIRAFFTDELILFFESNK